jgi:hypothetical protein
VVAINPAELKITTDIRHSSALRMEVTFAVKQSTY